MTERKVGRPDQGLRTQVRVAVTPEFLDRWRAACQAQNINSSGLLRDFMESKLDEWAKEAAA